MHNFRLHLYKGVRSFFSHLPVDIVTVRENTEDLEPNRDDPTAVGTREMAQAICDKMS